MVTSLSQLGNYKMNLEHLVPEKRQCSKNDGTCERSHFERAPVGHIRNNINNPIMVVVDDNPLNKMRNHGSIPKHIHTRNKLKT